MNEFDMIFAFMAVGAGLGFIVSLIIIFGAMFGWWSTDWFWNN